MPEKNYQDWETPPEAVKPLLRYLKSGWKLWEPACGQGRLVKALRGAGYEVIETGRENRGFFWYDEALPGVNAVVTNPPHADVTAWLDSLYYDIGLPFALLLPLRVLEHNKDRFGLWKKHGLQLLLLNDRIHYFDPKSGKQEKKTTFDSVWVCWKLLPRSICLGRL